MFSTLLGTLPDDPDRSAAGSDDDLRRLDNVAALGAAGLELVSTGSAPDGPDRPASEVVAAWQAASSAGAIPVKPVLLGPWTSARATGADPLTDAERLNETIRALAAAGCSLIEVAETDAVDIAGDAVAAVGFAAAHRRLLEGVEGIHCSLAVTGGNVDLAGAATFFDLAYASYAFDLIAGPDNWRLIGQAPADRGIICGALSVARGAMETREVLVWAAHYAASTNGRGVARVGLANAPAAPADPPPTRAEVLRRLAIVAEASRIAAVESPEEMAGLLDPRALDPRSAAFGRFAPARHRRP